jgi:hypothetical protein
LGVGDWYPTVAGNFARRGRASRSGNRISNPRPERGKWQAGMNHHRDRGPDNETFNDPGDWNRASYNHHPCDDFEPFAVYVRLNSKTLARRISSVAEGDGIRKTQFR